ncbi:MAG TPA: protein kinase [Gemmataceae bacterium]|nr:protein kinase [Gemmataceae bacterium]
MSGIDCPDCRSWQALLKGDRSDREAEELTRHLETCSACQHTLEILAADTTVWLDTAYALGEQRLKANQEPALRHVMERLKGESLPAGEADLSFLQPADDPNLLGLLESYQVQEVIGRGGMGVVLKAFDPVLHRLVAIKVLDPALAGNVLSRRRFTRETQAAAAVCHDHIVAVHAVSEASGLPYLVMQYIAGESLQARLEREGPLPIADVVRIGLQTASGLAAAHTQGLIHRDIKPANLLLENGLSRVKITDFGLARMSDDVGLTQNGVVAGTPEYMAPEQARGEVVDPRADLFSLGSVLYACCTGKPPFRGSTAISVLSQVTDKEPTAIRSLNPDIPAWLETFIARLMAKDSAQRFQSAAEAAALLESYLAHLSQPTTIAAPELTLPFPSPRACPEGAKRYDKVWLAVFAVLAVSFLLSSILGLFRAVAPTEPPRNGARSLEPTDGLTCLLVNKNSGRCLSLENGSATRGARIVQGPMPDQARATERWTLLGSSNGFRLRNESSGLVLEIGGGNLGPGVQAIQWHDQVKVPSQHWLFEPADNSYVLRAVHSQLVLAIGRSSLEEGGKAVQWRYVPDVADQCWELRPAYREQAYWPLKGKPKDRSLFGLFGPDAEQRVRFEPAGLRITLPPDDPKDRPDTGVTLATTIRGDFEIAVRFEILQETKPNAAAPLQTSFALNVVADDPEGEVATLRRQSGIREGSLFLACKRRKNGASGKQVEPAGLPITLPTMAKSGQLRLVRSGSVLSCYVAEGGDGPLTFLKRYPFSDKDVKEIRVTADAGHGAAFDVRVTDLHLGADSLPSLRKSDLVQAAVPKAKSKVWLVEGTVAVVVLVLIVGSLGERLYRRRSRFPESFAPAFKKKKLPVWIIRLAASLASLVARLRSCIPSLNRRLHMIVCAPASGKVSRLRRWIVLLLVIVFVPLAATPAESQKKPAAGAEKKTGTVNQLTASQSEQAEDAESFLPSPIPLRGDALSVGSVAFSPDGKILAMGAGWDQQTVGALRLWDVNKKQMIATMRTSRPVRSVAFSSDGKYLATAELDHTIKLRDPNSGAALATLSGHKAGVNSVAFSADCKMLAAAGLDHEVSVWDVAERKQRLRLIGHTDFVLAVAFSPDGKTMASVSRDHTGILWDLDSGKARVRLRGHRAGVECVAFAPNGKTVATGAWGGLVKLWEVADGKERSSLQGPGGSIFCLAYAPDGKTLAASGPGARGNVRFWDADSGEVRETLQTNVPSIYSIAFSPDGKRLAVTSPTGAVKLWDLADRKELAEVRSTNDRFFEPHPVLALAYAPDGKSVAVAGEDGGVQLCDVGTGIQRHVLKGHSDVVTCLAFSPDGTLLATGSPDQKIKLWDTASGKEVRTLEGHTSWVYALAFAPDGKTLASGSYDRTIRLWDAATGKNQRILKGHKASVRGVVFAPDGKTLASCSSDRTLKVWDVATGEALLKLKGHEGAVKALAFSADGKTLASASEDNTARLWDVKKGDERFVLRGHNEEVVSLAFSPHGSTLVTASLDSTLRVWNPATGKLRTTLQGHPEGATAVAISPNGRQLLSGGRDKSVKLWPSTPTNRFVISPRLMLTGHKKQVWFAVPSPDGKRLVTGGDDGTMRLWNVRPDALHFSYRMPDVGQSVAFAPDGRTLAASCNNGSIHIVDLATRKSGTILVGHTMPVVSIAFSPDGKKLLSTAGVWRNQQRPGEMKLWDVAAGKELLSFTGHEAIIPRVAFSPDGKTAASASLDKTARLWNLATGKELFVLKGHRSGVTSVVFSADGKTLLTSSSDRTIRIWDVATGKERRSLPTTLSGINCLALSPDGKTVALSENAAVNVPLGRFQVRDLETGALRADIRLPMGRVVSLAFAPDGGSLAVAGGNQTGGEVSLWDTTNWQLQALLPRYRRSVENVAFSRDCKRLAAQGLPNAKTGGITVWNLAVATPGNLTFKHGASAMSAAFSPTGKTLAVGLSYGDVQLWDAERGTLLGKLVGHTAQVRGVTFSPDGRILASAGNDGTIRLWEAATYKSKAVLKGHSDPRVIGVAFAPDGKTLVSVGWDQTAKVWDVASGAERSRLRVQAQVWSLALSPDGKTLATANGGVGMVKLWDVASGKEIRTLSHPPLARGLAFSPDGKLLAAGSSNGIIRLWSTADGKEMASLEGHNDPIFAVHFLPDGKTLTSAGKDGTARLWQVMTKDSAPIPVAGR